MLYIAYVAYPASDLNCMSFWRVACLVAYSDAFQDFRPEFSAVTWQVPNLH